jgi:hypothetical protein
MALSPFYTLDRDPFTAMRRLQDEVNRAFAAPRAEGFGSQPISAEMERIVTYERVSTARRRSCGLGKRSAGGSRPTPSSLAARSSLGSLRNASALARTAVEVTPSRQATLPSRDNWISKQPA